MRPVTPPEWTLLRMILSVAIGLGLGAALSKCHGAEVVASWYGEAHRGKLMANGKPFNPDARTAASWFYPLGTRLEVARGGTRTQVKVTDRGPAKRLLRTRQLDLSRRAFADLAPIEWGLVRVRIRVISW